MPLRLILDTNIYDRLVDRPDLLERACAAIQDDVLTLLFTHVQADQLAAIPASPKKVSIDRLLELLKQQGVPTSGALWDVSRWDEATYSDGAAEDALVHIIGESTQSHEDALIGATAAEQADVLVTEDARLRRRCDGLGKIEVWDFAELDRYLTALPPAGPA